MLTMMMVMMLEMMLTMMLVMMLMMSFVTFNEEGCLVSIVNLRVPKVLVENFPLHNLVYTQGNSHGTKIIPTSFELKKFVVTKIYVNVDVHLTT
jgi:hypothetical protein